MATLRTALFLSPTILHSYDRPFFSTSQPPLPSPSLIRLGSILTATVTPNDDPTVHIPPNYCRQPSIPSSLPQRKSLTLALVQQHQSHQQPSPARRLSTLGLDRLPPLRPFHEAPGPKFLQGHRLQLGLNWWILLDTYLRWCEYTSPEAENAVEEEATAAGTEAVARSLMTPPASWLEHVSAINAARRPFFRPLWLWLVQMSRENRLRIEAADDIDDAERERRGRENPRDAPRWARIIAISALLFIVVTLSNQPYEQMM
ncbi:hypothetical protein BJ508DRAFT_323347 [Ascobolus immersus RN42]|uniref:Uncharacterized protein n=1 Tax=Ascobolus immersus RN42 TaxID=1160509 RepID=A0A3N4IKX7_ASCIM|nr:hypothetical protein BJ508DRAFT_323347 [Ascobolus immersus RN42]